MNMNAFVNALSKKEFEDLQMDVRVRLQMEAELKKLPSPTQEEIDIFIKDSSMKAMKNYASRTSKNIVEAHRVLRFYTRK